MLSPLSKLISEIGGLDTGLYLLSRIAAAATFGHVRLYKYYITAQPVPDGELTPVRRGRRIIVNEASDREIFAGSIGRPDEVIKSRLAKHCRCLLARSAGTIVGFQWFTLEDYPEDEVRCLFRLRPEDRCAWDFDIFVVPEHRAQPVFTRLWDACNQKLREAGVTLCLSRINAFNGSSRRAHGRIGARSIGWAVMVCVGTLQTTLISTRPWLHVSFRESTIPVINVSRLARRFDDKCRRRDQR